MGQLPRIHSRIGKGQTAYIQRLRLSRINDPLSLPVYKAWYPAGPFVPAEGIKEPGKNRFPLSFHDPADPRMLFQKAYPIIGNLRAAQPQRSPRQQNFQISYKALHQGNIPDIAGKPDKIGLSLINIL